MGRPPVCAGPAPECRRAGAGVGCRRVGGDRFHVVTWEYDDDEVPDRPADLLNLVVQYIGRVSAERGEPAGALHYAGCGTDERGR